MRRGSQGAGACWALAKAVLERGRKHEGSTVSGRCLLQCKRDMPYVDPPCIERGQQALAFLLVQCAKNKTSGGEIPGKGVWTCCIRRMGSQHAVWPSLSSAKPRLLGAGVRRRQGSDEDIVPGVQDSSNHSFPMRHNANETGLDSGQRTAYAVARQEWVVTPRSAQTPRRSHTLQARQPYSGSQ